jgi:hypothetical protein
MDMHEKIKFGYWAIATQKHMDNFKQSAQNRDEFDTLCLAGKVGRFISNLRGSGQLENIDAITKLASSVGISRHELHNIIFPAISDITAGQIELKKNILGEVTGLEEYITSRRTVLEFAGTSFEAFNPKQKEIITVNTLDLTRNLPRLENELYDILAKIGYREEDILLACKLQEQFNLLQRVDAAGEAIYSNEYIWGKDHAKYARAIAVLDDIQKAGLSTIIDKTQNIQGIDMDTFNSYDPNIINLAQGIGIINPTRIITSRGISKSFAFSADLSKKITDEYDDDMLDDVKLFISAIRFGEKFTRHSRLVDYTRFIRSLITNGITKTPHSANGTDYVLLEQRGVVKMIRYGNTDRYFMKLLKKDVAEEALKAMESGPYNIGSTEEGGIDGLKYLNQFYTPESIRHQMAEPTPIIKETMDHLLRTIRSENLED